MPETSDIELLRDYSQRGSEKAFAALVQRHVNLVYSAALRQVGVAAQAEEIVQAVFIILARKAAGLRPNTILEAWLYETTRLTALSFLRGERRRQFREQEAYMQSTLQDGGDDSTWNQIAPLLDEAMARLGKKDREAVMLRFFKEKNLREVAAVLNVTEAAAQSRVHRALDKLRLYFSKRGVSSTTAIIGNEISAHSIHAAPIGLAKTVSAVAIAKGATASTSTLTLIKGALKLMFWSKTKIAISTGIGLLLVAGITTFSVEKVRGHDTAPTGMPDISGKPVTISALLISAQFIEVPDSLLDGQNLNWQPGDSGSSTAIISAVQQTNLVRALRRDRNTTVIGAPRIAFSPIPGKTSRGSVSMSEPDKNSPNKQNVDTLIDVTATMADDSQSVDLKLMADWQRLAEGAKMVPSTSDHAGPNAITTSANLSLNPGQTIVIRAPRQDGSVAGGSRDTTAGPRSLVIVVTPTIQNLKMRFEQKMVKSKTFGTNFTGSNNFTFTNSSAPNR